MTIRDDHEHHSAMVRLVVAQQWREAFVVLAFCELTYDRDGDRVWCLAWPASDEFDSGRVPLRSAVDVVAELVGVAGAG